MFISITHVLLMLVIFIPMIKFVCIVTDVYEVVTHVYVYTCMYKHDLGREIRVV